MKIKPCPFCGGIKKISALVGPCFGYNSYAIYCSKTDCQATGPRRLYPNSAIKAWNRRTGKAIKVLTAAYRADSFDGSRILKQIEAGERLAKEIELHKERLEISGLGQLVDMAAEVLGDK